MAKKIWHNIQKNISETPVVWEKKPENELWSVLSRYDSLIQEYWKEIVESALESLEIVWKFLCKPLDMKNPDMLETICNHLSIYRDKEKYVSYYGKEFGSEDAELTPTFARMLLEEKEYSLKNESALWHYKLLEKYIWKNSKCADLFCWSRDNNLSSIHGTVLIFSLLGVDKVLAVDLFNQTNGIQHNIDDFNYWYASYFPNSNAKKLIPWDIIRIQKNNNGWERAFPKFDIFNIKFDAYDCLKSMPDNSLDTIMINNVDYDIVQETKYEKLLREEVKRVVKNKWLVFGYGTTMWPKEIDYLFNERHGFTAFENSK